MTLRSSFLEIGEGLMDILVETESEHMVHTQLEGGVEITLLVRQLKIPVRLLVALSHHIACCIEHAQMKQTTCIAFFSKHLPPGEVVHQFAHAQNSIPGF